MVFKVSFKETEKHISKIVEKKGRTTTVNLLGEVRLPDFWNSIPDDISAWIARREKLEIYETNKSLYVLSEGKAKCREDDRYDTLLGERLAEARAKYYIYKFFYDLTCRLFDYYNRLLFGKIGVFDMGDGSCIAQDVKKYEALCIREAHHIGELLKDSGNGGE